MHHLAKGLLEFETLSADEIRKVIRGEKIVRDAGGPMEEPNRTPGRRSSVPPSGKAAGGLEPEPQPGA